MAIAPLVHVEQFVAARGQRQRKYLFLAFLFAILVGAALVYGLAFPITQTSTIGLDSGGGTRAAQRLGSPFLWPAMIVIGIMIPILVWRYARFTLFFILAGTCLFEISPTGYPDAITDLVPFFWNTNTFFQRYVHIEFKMIPLNLLEIFLIIAAAISAIQAVLLRKTNVRIGPLFWAIGIYIVFVAFGWFNGIATGGDFKISLQEVRAQFYFLVAYMIAVNMIRSRVTLSAVLWTTVLCIIAKGALYTFRRYVTLQGVTMLDQGVGSHEEAFFFDAYVLLLLSLAICRVYPRLLMVMWCGLPAVVIGNLACNRRAATAAMAITIPILLLAAYRALPERRKTILRVGLAIVIGFSIYFPLFRNSDGALGQPARAIQSQFQPDPRDASSNQYREAENACLMATVRLSPLLGYGYGKRMLHAAPIADISMMYEWWDVMTHNQILWVWMRVGSFGFLAFWMMIAAILIFACLFTRDRAPDNEMRSIGLFVLLVVAALLVFGLLDLQLSNYRDMIFAGMWVGILGALPTLPARETR